MLGNAVGNGPGRVWPASARFDGQGEKAGVGWPVGLHALRHSYATIVHMRGTPKEQIRNALGHHSWEFTGPSRAGPGTDGQSRPLHPRDTLVLRWRA